MGSPSTAPAYVHYGRGGWGNITSTQTGSYRRPSHDADPRPSHSPTRRFSTGIGGYANISSAKSSTSSDSQISEDLHSLLSSASTPGMVLSSSPSTHFGIGGHANKYQHDEDDVKAAKENNEKYRRASLKVLDERRASTQSEGGKSERSSRGSIVENLKDFLGGGRRASKH